MFYDYTSFIIDMSKNLITQEMRERQRRRIHSTPTLDKNNLCETQSEKTESMSQKSDIFMSI